MKNKIAILAVSLSLLVACAKEDSENVNQDSIYSIYELHFNKNLDKTTARATFRFGGPTGTLLDLTDPANVTFEGDALLYNTALGFHSKSYANLKDSGTFIYTDLEGKVFTNSMNKIYKTVVIDDEPPARNRLLKLLENFTDTFEVIGTAENGLIAKEKIEALNTSLPNDVQVVPFYDRTELITSAITTMRDVLLQMLLITAGVMWLFCVIAALAG